MVVMAITTPQTLGAVTTSACVYLSVAQKVSALTTVPVDVTRTTFLDDVTSTVAREAEVTLQNMSTLRPFISNAIRDVMDTVMHVGVIPVIVLCGVIMNVINMAVFLSQGLSDRVNICLFSLAVSDTGYMVFMMANRAHHILRYIDATAADYWATGCLSVVGVYVAFLNTSNCLVLLISLERCFCVVWPLKARTLLSDTTLKCLVLLAFVVSFLNNIMFSFKFATVTDADPITNATRYRLVFTELYRQHRDVIDFVLENVNIIVPTASVIVVMTTTTIIVVRMRSVLEWRQGRAQMTTSQDQREAALTRMLVVICVIYTACTLPFVTHSFFRLTVRGFGPGGHLENTANFTVGLVHAVATVNASANFVVYCTMSTRFRHTLQQMVRRKPAAASVAAARGTR
ncbi:uncharacterized protein LOC143294245 [Babylonia areolata]|uniref:uncharacterized protein LOC143294245 n=1 Tax=Babylonia areolata TaxID=304850 RepID=UPI003FCF8552